LGNGKIGQRKMRLNQKSNIYVTAKKRNQKFSATEKLATVNKAKNA